MTYRQSIQTLLRRHSVNTATAMVAVFVLCACGGMSQGERFRRDCEEYTDRYCPQRKDRCQVLDSITYDVTEETMHTWYSLGGELDSAHIYTSDMRERVRESLVGNLRNNISMKKYKDAGITFTYHYASERTANEYFALTLTREDY